MEMIWLMMWLNVSEVILNAMLQFYIDIDLDLKVQDKFRKNDKNDMVADVT